MKYSTPWLGPFGALTWQGSTTDPFRIPELPKSGSAGFETAPNPGTVANQFNPCAYCYASISANQTIGTTPTKVSFDTFSTNTNGMADSVNGWVKIHRAWFYSVTVWMNIVSTVEWRYGFDVNLNGNIIATNGLNPFAWTSIATVNTVIYLAEWDFLASYAIGDTAYSNAATFIRVIELWIHAV